MAKDAAKEPHCFENCRAKDGRMIRLTKKRYDEHVLEDHPDLVRDFAYPVSEIQKALENAESIRPGAWGATQVYIGPIIKPDKLQGNFGFNLAPRRMHVVVWREGSDGGHVMTAMTVTEPLPRGR